jgi:thioredoxin reductase (NADPH)
MSARAVSATPLPETPDHEGAYPRLDDEQLARLAPVGRTRPTTAGEVLFREGDEDYDFIVVLEGKVAIVQGERDDQRLIAVHGPRRFLGELGLLTGQAAFLTAVVHQAGSVLEVPVDRLYELATRDSALGDLILRAYLIRREILIGLGAGLKIVGSRYSPQARELRDLCARNRVPHRWIDLEEDASAEDLLRRLGVSPQETPVVIWHGEVLRNPTPGELADAIGLPDIPAAVEVCDLVVVGAGPAGLAAAVYGASEGLGTVALDAVATGGQAATSSRIENYLGFPAGLSGAELAERATIQARKFGARLAVPATAVALDRSGGHHVIRLASGQALETRCVVIATGARYRKLAVPRLEAFEPNSVYYAATLMEAQRCAGEPVVVVGGGNSAGQATTFLARHATQVHLVLREDDLEVNMSRYLADRIRGLRNVDVRRHSEVRELLGDDRLEAVVVEDRLSGARDRLDAQALFVFIGAEPCTDWLRGVVALDDGGYVVTGAECVPEGRRAMLLETSRPGVLAIGDVRSGSIKRVASAVGEGSMAVRLVHEYLGTLR